MGGEPYLVDADQPEHMRSAGGIGMASQPAGGLFRLWPVCLQIHARILDALPLLNGIDNRQRPCLDLSVGQLSIPIAYIDA
jgi:hypothetical protein